MPPSLPDGCGQNKALSRLFSFIVIAACAIIFRFCACFNDADHAVVADVYAAGEDPIEGFEKEDCEGLRAWGHRSVHVLSDPEALAEQIDKLASSGDLVMCLGAGTVTAWAAALPEQLVELRNTLW